MYSLYQSLLQNLERQIDGESFVELTREDFSLIFPNNDKFLVGSRLYKTAKNAKSVGESGQRNTDSLLYEMDDLAGSFSSQTSMAKSSASCAPLPASGSSTPHSTVSRASTPVSRKSSASTISCDEFGTARKKRCIDHGSGKQFQLPVFSPGVTRCIRKDEFYTSTQRNRLIKEACNHLRGFCWEQGLPISNAAKRDLAKSLHGLAPKSLGDPGKGTNHEVSFACVSNVTCVFHTSGVKLCAI